MIKNYALAMTKQNQNASDKKKPVDKDKMRYDYSNK